MQIALHSWGGVSGDLVFDPCAGSGSHLLVAKENNRNFLGTELDTNYYNLAKERIESL